MNLPTVKKMVEWGFGQDEAVKIRARMEKYRDRFPFGDKWPTQALQDIAAIMDEVEIVDIPSGSNQKSPRFFYVATGDMYDTTVLFYNRTFHIGNAGTILEQGNYA